MKVVWRGGDDTKYTHMHAHMSLTHRNTTFHYMHTGRTDICNANQKSRTHIRTKTKFCWYD